MNGNRGKLPAIIAAERDIAVDRIKAVIELLDEGNTIPFIARYRKELTGELDEEEIREIKDRINYLRKLEERKSEVTRLIKKQDELTPELEDKINGAEILREVEDLYRPFKPRRRTRATRAREKGLEPLAKLVWEQEIKEGKPAGFAVDFIDPEQDLTTPEEVYGGVRDIIAEWISDDAGIRKRIRKIIYQKGYLRSTLREEDLDKKRKYKLYYDYREAVDKIPPHRILALNRGEEEGILNISVQVPEKEIIELIKDEVLSGQSIFRGQIVGAVKDSWQRLIQPSMSRELRNNLTAKAEEQAREVFGANLRSLLLQPPLKGHTVMGVDPGFRTGCKLCTVNERGRLLATATIYPHPPVNKKEEAEEILHDLIDCYSVESIAIGNGTAARETESVIAGVVQQYPGVKYTIVNEAGASVYSASRLAREEFPDLDVALRGAVSIARRLQDPLAELVKINPRHIGVGLYQHDLDEKKLEASLAAVVESVVNYVGVDVNTASPSLLEYVAGINSRVAKNIVHYRENNNGFKKREELKEVYGLGPKTYQQAAGFIRIPGGSNPLALTPIHPESYRETEKLINDLGFVIEDLRDRNRLRELREVLAGVKVESKARELKLGVPTLKDIIKALKKPGRDPREKLPGPVFRKDILQLEDLKEGLVLQGTVRNVVDFGVFVDIGLKRDGLVHISELSYSYVENPLEIAGVGDVVRVKVVDIDRERERVSLSMKL